MNDVYENYELNDGVYIWSLTDKDKLVLDSAIYLLDNKCSLRKLSRNMLRSKSSLHRDLTIRLRELSFELYSCCKRQLSENKEKYFR